MLEGFSCLTSLLLLARVCDALPNALHPSECPMHTLRLALLSLLLTSLLSACASPRAQWEKPGANSTQAHSTYAGCQYELGLTDKSANEEQTLLKYCMERDGYRLQSY
tara:strand:- start:91 stop:414 length:324 start_codon:yes stop_codon:yes gene_type:complete